MKTRRISEIEKIIKESAFNKDKYEVNIRVKRLVNGLMMYINSDIKEPTTEDIFKYGVPEFQRDNNIWTEEMQIKFIENVLKGFRTKIQLFEIESSEKGCQILDGLQRVTAFAAFVDNKFKIFDNSVNFDDIKDVFLNGLETNFIVEIFKFKDLNETIDFYVEMNENITHSPEDIEKAIRYKK